MLVTIVAALLIKLCFGTDYGDEYPPYALQVTTTSFCLDVPGGEAYNGAQLWVWSCIAGDVNQRFWESVSSTSARIHYRKTEFVLDAGSNLAVGNPLMLWQTNDSPQQLFEVSDSGIGEGEIWTTSNGLCVNVDTLADGAAVHLAECGESGNTLWNYNYSFFNPPVSV